MKVSKLLVVLLLALSATAFADWQGSMKITVTGKSLHGHSRVITAVIHSRKDKERMDMTSPPGISTILDLKTHKAWSLIHSTKMVMTANFKQAASRIPECISGEARACLKKSGFRKIGQGSANGHHCSIYQKQASVQGHREKIKVWQPDDLTEVIAVRVLAMTNGSQVLTDITDIKTKRQPNSLFEVPKNYHSMGNIQDLMKSFKGMHLPGSH